MSKHRKYALALTLLVVLCVNGTAVAASRDEGSRNGRGSDLFSRVRDRIVRILDDIRGSFPPG